VPETTGVFLAQDNVPNVLLITWKEESLSFLRTVTFLQRLPSAQIFTLFRHSQVLLFFKKIYDVLFGSSGLTAGNNFCVLCSVLKLWLGLGGGGGGCYSGVCSKWFLKCGDHQSYTVCIG
jgi:hypothetical protein